MVGVIRGFDELRNAEGVLVAPLGFGHQSDWEIIERIEVTAAVGTVDLDLNGAGFDPTLYDEYEITISGLTHSADGGLHARTSTDGGTTYDAGVSDYSWIANRVSHTTSEFVARTGNAASNIMVIGDALGASTNEVSSWRIWCGQLDDGKHKSFVYQGTGRISDANGYSYWGGGMRESTTDINGIQFFVGAGNINGGVFTLRGRRKVPATFVNQSDWEVLSEKVANNDANISFEPADFDTTQYDEFEIEIIDAVGASDGADLRLTVSDDGGATYEATSYHYANNRWGSGTSPALITNSTSATHGQMARALGNGTGEAFNFRIKVNALDQTATYKVFHFEGMTWGNGAVNLLKWTGQTAWVGATNAIDGIRFTMDNAGAQNITSGKFRLRGRRKAPAGAAVSSGDFKHLGDFNVATAGDTFIDVDMRESINSQFTSDFQDTDFLFMLSGSIGPSNATLHFRVVRDGTQQSGASDYKSDNSNGANNIRMTASTPGTGRKIVARGHLFRYNNAASTAFFGVTGESFSADSGGTREPLGFWGGHANGLPSGLNNGFRVYCSAGDMDDITISVYGFKRSQT
jgi:hypothetical protein